MTTIDINTDVVRQAADQLADEIGVERASVRVIDPKWVNILSAGAKVDLHIGRWRAESTLSLEDFGIEPKSEDERRAYRSILKMPNGYLLPEKQRRAAQSLEDKARNLLRDRSYETHWGAFVAKGNADPERDRETGWYYKQWRDETEAIRVEYMALRDEIYEQWDDLMQQVRREYAIIGAQNYTRLQATGKIGMPDVEEWIKAFVDRRMSKVPSREAVRDSFVFKWGVSYIPLQQLLAEDQAAAERVRAEGQQASAEIFAKAQVAMEMERDIQRVRVETIQTGLQTFASDLRGQLTGLVYECATDVLEAINKNGTVPGASVKQLRNVVEKIGALNIWDEAQLKRQMADLRRLMQGASPADRTTEVRDTLRRIGAEAKLVLLELERPDVRSSRSVGIPDTIAGLKFVTGNVSRTGERAAINVPLSLDLDMSRSGTGRAVSSMAAD